ncbi:MAG TPA: phosphodiesterase [Labilithrix sp.]|jgi:3',5'-cyclic AMP phosphodiesterase CpdA|nr:phosphodiesterase [Labilithrix sp.]
MLIAQISDTHICEQGKVCCRRVDTGPFLAKTVARLNELHPTPNLVVVTGDLVDEATPAAYARLRAHLEPLAMPYYLAVANHDRREALRAAFPDQTYLSGGRFVQYTVEDFALRLIVLDTSIPDRHAGELCEDRLHWLESRLSEQPARPTLIFMHHPPFMSGNTAFDRLDLAGAGRLAEVVSQFRNVEGIFCGHLHRPIQARFGGTFAMTCPSTAHQVHLSLGEASLLAFAMEPPVFVLHWWNGSSLVTHIALVDRFDGPFSVDDGRRLRGP